MFVMGVKILLFLLYYPVVFPIILIIYAIFRIASINTNIQKETALFNVFAEEDLIDYNS
jgi:hypothetical protein